MNTIQTLEAITQSILEMKGIDLVTLNIEKRSVYADYMVICHGTSTAHVKGISDKIEMTIKKRKVLPLGVEGYNEARWVLMDYNTVVVHIFLKKTRADYQIEQLYQAVDERNQE